MITAVGCMLVRAHTFVCLRTCAFLGRFHLAAFLIVHVALRFRLLRLNEAFRRKRAPDPLALRTASARHPARLIACTIRFRRGHFRVTLDARHCPPPHYW